MTKTPVELASLVGDYLGVLRVDKAGEYTYEILGERFVNDMLKYLDNHNYEILEIRNAPLSNKVIIEVQKNGCCLA